jgi:glycerophosphoryl diester phosphodiesterase
MWTYPRVLAHRGGGILAPENTMAALRCAVAHGFHAVEFDVMAVRGDGLVLMHDPQLGRTVVGEGRVADFTLDELVAMDAGGWHSPVFSGEPVAGFADAAQFCLAHHLWMNAEIKPAPGMDTRTGFLVGQACSRLPPGSALLSSFSIEALLAAQEAAPEVPRAWLVDVVPADWAFTVQRLGASALHVNARFLTKAQAVAVKEAGYGLFCYTVNEPDQARALRAIGVDAICTDRLDLIGAHFFDGAPQA